MKLDNILENCFIDKYIISYADFKTMFDLSERTKK